MNRCTSTAPDHWRYTFENFFVARTLTYTLRFSDIPLTLRRTIPTLWLFKREYQHLLLNRTTPVGRCESIRIISNYTTWTWKTRTGSALRQSPSANMEVGLGSMLVDFMGTKIHSMQMRAHKCIFGDILRSVMFNMEGITSKLRIQIGSDEFHHRSKRFGLFWWEYYRSQRPWICHC